MPWPAPPRPGQLFCDIHVSMASLDASAGRLLATFAIAPDVLARARKLSPQQ